MSERTKIGATYESDRSFVTATQGSDKVAVYYYADRETSEIPFTVAMGPHGGEYYVEMTTPEMAEWLRALGQLYNDAIRDGR